MNRYLKNHLCKCLRNDGIGRKFLLKEILKLGGRFKREAVYLKELEEQGIEVVACDEEIYPKYLKEIPDFPVLLFLKGKKELLNEKLVTIVGTRSMSKYGEKVVKRTICSNKGLCFVSGLARGVDGEVHRNCLENNIPTIAITAGGMNQGFPKSNTKLFERISKQGLVVSEFPPGRKIVKGMFPMRNRILAGISKASVIVESGIKGGSMITANLALEYGREVIAVPGNIFSTSSEGCNSLISQGANIAINIEQFKSLLNDCIH